jgi:hypothetical protein
MKQKLLFIIPSLTYGGAEAVLSRLTKELIKKYEIYIVIFQKDIKYDFSGKLICLNEPATNNPLLKFGRFLKRVYKIRKIKNHIKPIFSISFLDNANIVNIF